MAAHKYVPSYMYSAKYVMDVGRCTIKIKYTVRRTPEYTYAYETNFWNPKYICLEERRIIKHKYYVRNGTQECTQVMLII